MIHPLKVRKLLVIFHLLPIYSHQLGFNLLRMFVTTTSAVKPHHLTYTTGDGCSHHASFHIMENPHEVEIVSRWQAAERAQQEVNGDTRSRKRPRRAIENTPASQTSMQETQIGASRVTANLRSRSNGNKQKTKSSTNTAARVVELPDEEEEDVENFAGSGSASFWRS
jgi:hypothetical protein